MLCIKDHGKMYFLHLSIILFSFINSSKSQSIAFEFTSKDINELQNYITITPEPNMTFTSGLTICFRVKLEYWDVQPIFASKQIFFNIFPFSLRRVVVRLEDIRLIFKWPEPKITTTTTWSIFHQPFYFKHIKHVLKI